MNAYDTDRMILAKLAEVVDDDTLRRAKFTRGEVRIFRAYKTKRNTRNMYRDILDLSMDELADLRDAYFNATYDWQENKYNVEPRQIEETFDESFEPWVTDILIEEFADEFDEEFGLDYDDQRVTNRYEELIFSYDVLQNWRQSQTF